tara:strand:+ start:739 stop:948 length:210 start_codon:yes stop_codon:yes gene_type:complete
VVLMTASEEEIKAIMRILRKYWPETSIEMVIGEVWEQVGENSSNESLKETVRLMYRDISPHFLTRDEDE